MSSKKIKILIDLNPLVQQNKSGVGYYTYCLIDELAKSYPNEIKIIGHYFNFLGLQNPVLPKHSNITYKQSRFIPSKFLSLSRKLGFQIPLEFLFKEKGDVAIFTNFVSLPSIFNIPTIVAVHDLCYEEVPDYVSDKNRKFLHKFVPKSIKKSELVITISESTKNSIKKYYSVEDDKILITPIPPVSPVFKNKDTLKRFGLKDKYILFVSNLEPRKNFINLVKAYEQLPLSIKESHSLVLVGGIGWKVENDINYIKKSQEKNKNIIMTGYVSDDEKSALYTNATLFVMPSHYEGFGMPILEAMSYSVPTAISDIPVFHEVAKNNSIYFDKDNIKDMSTKLNDLLKDTKSLNKYSKQGKEHLKNYSWDKVSEIVYKKITSLL